MASNDFINECKTPAYEDRLGKITIDGTEYNQGNKLTSLTLENNIYNNGSIIGSTYTKSLKFSLIDVDKDTQFVGKKALPSVGVKYPNNTTEYIDLDEFTLEELNDEQTKNFTDITGYDALCDIDKPFTYTLGDGTHTVLEYWNNLVESLGLETETTSFTNDSIIIPANPFVNNESNRTVLSEIEKISCTFAKVEKRTRTVEGVTQTYHVINLVWFDENHEETTTIDGSGTLNNVSRLSDLKLQGNTTQSGTPTPSSPQPINVVSGRQEVNVLGKNLYNKDNISYAYINSSGVVVNNVPNNALSDYILVDKNTNYVFSANTIMNGLNVAFFDSQKQFTSRKMEQSANYNSFNTENNSYIRVWCNFNGATEMTPSVIESKEVQLEKNETPTTYEAYKEQSYEINLGKNLLKFDLATAKLYNTQGTWTDNAYSFYGIDATVNEDNTITIGGGSPTAGYNFYLYRNETGKRLSLQAGTYTFSTNTSPESGNGNFVIRFRDNEGNTISGVSDIWLSGGTSTSVTKTINQDFQIAIYIQISAGTGITEPEKTYQIQIEKGSISTSWSAYKTPIELCKIGTYQDRIYKDNGTWYLHKEIGKVVLNGSEDYWTDTPSGYARFGTHISNIKTFSPARNIDGILSQYFKPDTNNTTGVIYSSNEEICLYPTDTSITTTTQFKTWLSTHNTIVYYPLAIPTTTEITDEELINQLESIRLLKGTNNIFITSGDLSSKTSFTYYLTNPDYEFTTGDYSTLEGSLTKYGPLNSIMLGRENIGGENVVREDEESITLNGEHKILIDAEYFLFNQTLREQAIEAIYDKLDGFEYYDLSLTTYYGKPFLEVGNKIRVNTNEGNVYDTYILSHEFTYDGTFKSKIESPALTEQQEIVKTTESVSNRMRRTEIMVDKANGEITSLTTQTQEIQDDLAQNYYTSTQTNELIQTASTGLTNTFSEAGGNNIFRNTGLWFGATTSKATLLPSNDLYPSEELFMGNEFVYEFWEGVVKRRKEDKASNMIAMVLQNGYLTQEQLVPNGKYTVSFKYNKLIALAVAKVFINDVEYPLNNVGDTEFIQIIEVNSQHINIKFYCSIDDGCEIYDLMVNAGEVKLAYSQNQNETTTDTVNISKGITITSSNLDVKFKADADGIRTLDNNDVEITKFTDTGMKTKEAIIEGKSQIVGTLWQEVGSQTWITRL